MGVHYIKIEKCDQYLSLQAGRTNPDVHLRLINLAAVTPTDPPAWTEIDAPTIVTDEHVLGTVFWIDNNRVGVYWMNRRQNFASIQSCNFGTTLCEEVRKGIYNLLRKLYRFSTFQLLQISEQLGWIDVNTPRCTSDGGKCFFRANSQGWTRIASLDTTTRALVYESRAGVTALSFNGYNEATQTL
jgi:dipeptidyl-peptidase 4